MNHATTPAYELEFDVPTLRAKVEAKLNKLRETSSEQLILPFCPSPWVHNFASPSGGLRPCYLITDDYGDLTKPGSMLIVLAKRRDRINRMVYLFCNPAKAGLVASIEQYPGLNTWEVFKTCEPSVDAEVRIKAYWTPVALHEPLPEGNRLSPANDREVARQIRETEGTLEYELVVKPLAWLRAYGMTDPKQI